MGRKLYVGNLTYGVDSSQLEQMFAEHGTVQSAQVIMDRDTGRSKGFGFVEMGTDQEARPPSRPSTARRWTAAS
jgi:RNA recognition motif-containing protein